MANNYDNIPDELKWGKSWAIAGPDETNQFKAPYGIGPRGIFKLSPTQDFHWRDFESVAEFAEANPPHGIGYVLSKNDAYTVIDLDVKNKHNEPDPSKWTSQEDLDRYWRIIQAFDSYAELSASGQGVHIWVRGFIGQGCKRDGVEVYSKERFIVCTGNKINDKDIEERQELLNILVAEIRRAGGSKVELVERGAFEDDETILERARTAENAEKFNALFSGDWTGYPSQSEADLALMSIFTFYSKSNEQCRRLFRLSGLGQRKKAVKNNYYLDQTLKLIRGREEGEEAADAIGEAAARNLIQNFEQNKLQEALTTPAPASEPVQEVYTEEDYADPLAPIEPDTTTAPDDGVGIPWPPGFIGALAQYIYNNSVRPVKEVSIVAAMGLMAGICGKAFSIPQSGLNLYIVLVAQSGIGKEAMHSGISNVIHFVGESEPSIFDFVDYNDYASGPALLKASNAAQSFVNISGEWGRKLKRLAVEDGREGPMQQLRTVMTNLYQKSGSKSIVGGIGYSDKEKNVASVSGVAYSMIGESTPKTFYDALTESMMEDGFLSRFTVIEYTGSRPAANPKPLLTPPRPLLDALCYLTKRARELINRFAVQDVERDAEAEDLLNTFDKECDQKINASKDEGFRQMWNRAHLKAYRIAALLAVGDNPDFPLINRVHAEWALEIIRKDIAIMDKRMNSGDVGIGDGPREKKVLSSIAKYLKFGVAASYGIPSGMREASVVPRKYLQIVTQRSSSFINHRAGSNIALDLTLKALCDSGYLQELSKEKSATQFSFTGKCYRVISIPNSILSKLGEDTDI